MMMESWKSVGVMADEVKQTVLTYKRPPPKRRGPPQAIASGNRVLAAADEADVRWRAKEEQKQLH
jgi:hypothetical protein